MSVVPLHRCKCGAAGAPRDVEFQGREIGEIIVCDRCLIETAGTLARVRPIFDKMLECGIPRQDADDTMTFLLERIG